MNGILGDEMGLGKNCTLALFQYLKESTTLNVPYLVVCPLSVIDGWVLTSLGKVKEVYADD